MLAFYRLPGLRACPGLTWRADFISQGWGLASSEQQSPGSTWWPASSPCPSSVLSRVRWGSSIQAAYQTHWKNKPLSRFSSRSKRPVVLEGQSRAHQREGHHRPVMAIQAQAAVRRGEEGVIALREPIACSRVVGPAAYLQTESP